MCKKSTERQTMNRRTQCVSKPPKKAQFDHLTHDDLPRHCVSDFLAKLGECLEDISLQMRKFAGHPQLVMGNITNCGISHPSLEGKPNVISSATGFPKVLCLSLFVL